MPQHSAQPVPDQPDFEASADRETAHRPQPFGPARKGVARKGVARTVRAPKGMARVAALIGAMFLASGAWLAVISCSGPSLGLAPAVMDERGGDPTSAPAAPTSPEVDRATVRAQPRAMTSEQKAAVIERTTSLVRDRAYASGVDFGRWERILADYQERLDEATTSEQFSRHLNRALNEFGISHLDILAPTAATRRRENTYGGIGVVISPADDGLRIEQVREGSPAEKAGLLVGDVVTAVDGKPVTDLNAIRGEPGTSVELTVRREPKADAVQGPGKEAQGDAKPQVIVAQPESKPESKPEARIEKLTLTRGKISTAIPPSIETVGDDAVVLKLRSFTEGYDRAAIEKLFRQAKGKSLLVLDLRDNGGGSVSNLMHLLGLMLPPGSEVGTFVSKQMAESYAEDTGKDASDVVAVAKWASRKMRTRRIANIDPFAGQIAVLTNGASASASEITAAALRELRGSPLVGTRTAGAVLLSTYVRMEGGFEMKVPTSDYVTIKGHRLEDNPLVPDVNAGSRFSRRAAAASAEKDPVVGEAIEHLRANADAGTLRSE